VKNLSTAPKAKPAAPEQPGRQLVEKGSYNFEGYIDFLGYHSRAGGWFVGGWIAYPWPSGQDPQHAAAVLADNSMISCSLSMFYDRADLAGRGVGFVFFFPLSETQTEAVLCTVVMVGGAPRTIFPSAGVTPRSEPLLAAMLSDLLAGGEIGSYRQQMEALLFGEGSREPVKGFVDFYGYHPAAAGWVFSGWIAQGWREGQSPDRIVLSFDEGDIDGDAFAILYPRHDLSDDGLGIAFFVTGGHRPLGKLNSVKFNFDDNRAVLDTAQTTSRLQGVNLMTQFRSVLALAVPGLHRDILTNLVARQPFQGDDTLATLSPLAFLEIDEAIRSGADGLVLIGWYLAMPNEVHAIRVRCGSLIASLDMESCIRIDRPDVIEAFGRHGFSDSRCGFIAWLPHAVIADGAVYIEVETMRRRVAYRKVAPPKLEGIAAIKRLLSSVDIRFTEVQPAFDLVLGPAVEGLNQTRLAGHTQINVIEYGRVAPKPRFSVVVPVYGRLDFVEYQLALFSAHPNCADIEFIYVLDDPPKRKEAQFLFTSVFERFRIPFKAVLLDRNVGYAPANNIGLAEARGEFVAFLNSDVFPGTLDWLERLSDRLIADPGIGAIGPVLLFEDGSVQHRGMQFARLTEFGNWHFGMHPNKGMRPAKNGTPEVHLSITGACMLMRREFALDLGGFDETYVIGDFEDSDLCLKLAERGKHCVVDPGVELFHLERKSQASSALGWRMNLTVYNAWQHERRWGETIAARQGH
jgi:GT2 family glycosyltransferase